MVSTPSAEFVTRFGIVDYVVFVAMLAVSASIGFYYGCSGSRQRTAGEFLMGNRSMGVLPIGLSLLASFLSAIGLLGIPAEIYTFGTSFWINILCYLVVFPISAYVYLPVFYDLNLTSAYEYLERRFNRVVRRSASIIFMFQMLLYMAMVTYAPALALSHVTGLHVWGSVAAIGLVCICYTTVGGIKAVMWTDAFQVIIMVAAMLTVCIRGLVTLGGFQGIWKTAQEGQRIATLDFDPNPFVRHTVWCLTVGSVFTWVAIYGVNQTQVQRYLTSPNIKTAQRAIWLNCPSLLFTISLCCFAGLVLYAQFSTCDPLKANIIKTTDQLLPLYVMESLGEFPGLPGFFVAGIFSGSLSTLSSGLNSLAAVTLEDFLRLLCLKNISDERAGFVSKGLALAFGAVALGLVAVVEQLGNILQAAVSIFGIIGGPLLGVFSLGMFFPWANAWGAITGLFSSLIIILWIGIGAQVVKPPKPFLPVTITGCNGILLNNETILVKPQPYEYSEIYKLSYQWYSTFACLIVIIVGLIVSFLTGYQKMEELDEKLLCPPIRALIRNIPEKGRKFLCCNYKDTSGDTPNEVIEVTAYGGKDNPTFSSADEENVKTSTHNSK